MGDFAERKTPKKGRKKAWALVLGIDSQGAWTLVDRSRGSGPYSPQFNVPWRESGSNSSRSVSLPCLHGIHVSPFYFLHLIRSSLFLLSRRLPHILAWLTDCRKNLCVARELSWKFGRTQVPLVGIPLFGSERRSQKLAGIRPHVSATSRSRK